MNFCIWRSGKKVDKTAKGEADDLGAKGAKYYAKLRDAVTNPKEKQFFDLLSRMENEHYLSQGY
jgi:hypothetical protein